MHRWRWWSTATTSARTAAWPIASSRRCDGASAGGCVLRSATSRSPRCIPTRCRAAEAAEAAGAQGKFWEMHDLLYENQQALDDPDLLGYAAALKLDVPRFVSELADRTWEARVREDFMTGVRSGVNGTPTFFVNGIRHDGPWDADSVVEALSVVAPVHA